MGQCSFSVQREGQGTARVKNPECFTLEFARDGFATLRLDCNRGSGSYQVEASADGSSGSLSFGPIAATRALCVAAGVKMVRI